MHLQLILSKRKAVIETPRACHRMENGNVTNPQSYAAAPFRSLIPGPDHPKVKFLSSSDASSWCQLKRENPELAWFIDRLDIKSLDKPYKGFTVGGQVKDGLFNHVVDEGAPVAAMVAAAEDVLSQLTPDERARTCFESVEADEIRIWSNPELYVNQGEDICSFTVPTNYSRSETDSFRWNTSG